ncbi:hypothetical protein C427_4839 [Paraglaciecola psychrophila 170]|uniref:Uncharacterized protein n=1 Tax=Paraglaciecola psychrophila 170 TaxID=1129794 RepID=K6Z4G9_9ALTE|nr:hypothetical protein C427_4839 [Paraglaciecola psychrophila 170]GAC39969.1 hypothetical protein GPSY_4366 [Paraglaciecola psychrophila 170]
MKATYKPTIGLTPATKANATAYGTNAKAKVIPDNTSYLTLLSLLVFRSNI